MKLLNFKLSPTLIGLLIATAIPTTANAAGSYYNCVGSASNASCQEVKTKRWTSKYTQTKYPVVLAHGLGGFSRMFNMVDYFHGIPKELMKGGSTVYATKVSAINNSEFRGEQLLRQVQTITAVTGNNQKVNLVGHSQGGIDIRYVAGVAPNLVASVTAVSSPEQGSATADWALNSFVGGTEQDGYTPNTINLQSKAIMAVMNVIGLSTDIASGASLKELQQQDGWEAANGLTKGYMANFNARFPAAMPTEYCGQPADTKVNGIPYYSFSGTSKLTNIFDFTDAIMVLTGLTFGNDPNDGLVSACSSRLGHVLRDDYRMNHLDSVNQFLGITSLFETNPKSVYRAQIHRLKNQGL